MFFFSIYWFNGQIIKQGITHACMIGKNISFSTAIAVIIKLIMYTELLNKRKFIKSETRENKINFQKILSKKVEQVEVDKPK